MCTYTFLWSNIYSNCPFYVIWMHKIIYLLKFFLPKAADAILNFLNKTLRRLSVNHNGETELTIVSWMIPQMIYLMHHFHWMIFGLISFFKCIPLFHNTNTIPNNIYILLNRSLVKFVVYICVRGYPKCCFEYYYEYCYSVAFTVLQKPHKKHTMLGKSYWYRTI